MSSELSPLYAANLASDVYDVSSVTTRGAFLGIYKDDMEIEKATTATGITGGYILNKPQVMALFSAGKGAYKGHAFVAVKGTASLYDALTDLNAGLRTSHTGSAVHQGFYYALNSILLELKQFVSGLSGVRVIHCVGHSLGGAIATLAADWIKASTSIPEVNLYSFGSPRVGLEMFATKCTSRLNEENIYRVYHQTDPVPMVPTWPFRHVPTSNADYLVYSPIAAKPWEYHLMKHYIASSKKAMNWSAIIDKRPKAHMDAAVERWLTSDGVLSLTANTLELMDAALLYVIKKAINAAGILVVTAAASAFTLLDRLAMFMAKAGKVSADVNMWVYHLMKKMASLIGIKVVEGTDLTVSFIRVVFLRLHHKISELVLQAGRHVF